MGACVRGPQQVEAPASGLGARQEQEQGLQLCAKGNLQVGRSCFSVTAGREGARGLGDWPWQCYGVSGVSVHGVHLQGWNFRCPGGHIRLGSWNIFWDTSSTSRSRSTAGEGVFASAAVSCSHVYFKVERGGQGGVP